MNNRSNSLSRTAYLVRLGALLAIVVVLTTLNIGNIPIGPIVATIYQVPVIIGAVLLGTGAGAVLGGAWGLLCFWLAFTGQTTDVVALAIIQQSPLTYFAIAFLPRLLTGVAAGLVYRLTSRLFKSRRSIPALAITGAAGALCNTVLYLGSLYLLVRELLAEVYSIDLGAVLGMVLGVASTNGVAEAAVSAVVVSAVCRVLLAVFERKN